MQTSSSNKSDFVNSTYVLRVIRCTLYPGLLGGAVALTMLISDVLSPTWAMNLTSISIAILLILIETAMPYRLKWKPVRREVTTDIAYVGLSLLVLLTIAPVMSLLLWLQPHVAMGIWPTSRHLVLQVAFALLIYELGSYSFHWLCHHTLFWRFHAVHHSPQRLYWLNSARSHPLDYFLAIVATSTPLLLLGCGPDVFALVSVFGITNMMLQHTNADLRTGILDWIFVTPTIHRWHHSRSQEEQGSNLGSVLIVWDLVFRSRIAPKDQQPPESVGNGIERYPQTLMQQLISPVRRELWREDCFNEEKR